MGSVCFEIYKSSHCVYLGEKILGVKRESMMKYYDAEGNVPLHSAVHSGDIKVIQYGKSMSLIFLSSYRQ